MTKRYPTPEKPGHYWAKWRIAADGTHEGEELTPCDTWEVVQVNDNGGEAGSLEELSVSIPGVRETQWRDGFIWGPRVADFRDERDEPGLTEAEMKAQGARCGCKGVDDMCVCQNVTDATTRADRVQRGRR